MKVTLIANDSIQSQALETLLLSKGVPLQEHITIKKRSGPSNDRARSNWLTSKIKGLLNLFSEERRLLKREQDYANKAALALEAYVQAIPPGPPVEIRRVEAPSVNDSIVRQRLIDSPCDICVVYGTGIIKAELIALAKKCFLNAHSSVLPEYRGTRAEFWQCYEQQYDHVGITIHAIDVGVDTGMFYFQKKQEPIDLAEPYHLRTLNTISMLEHYPRVVLEVLNGSIEPQTQAVPRRTRAYRFADITLEKRLQLYGRLK